MKKIMTGMTLVVFALAPMLAWADCGGEHDQASMASTKPVVKTDVQASAGKSSSHAVAKVSAKKGALTKKSTAPKIDRSTVVAKNN
jgi:hypothetical protein